MSKVSPLWQRHHPEADETVEAFDAFLEPPAYYEWHSALRSLGLDMSYHSWMVCFCFMVDQKRKVRSTKPVAGTCSRCGGGASVGDMITATRFCYVPVYWKSWKAIICTFCGAILKSYR